MKIDASHICAYSTGTILKLFNSKATPIQRDKIV